MDWYSEISKIAKKVYFEGKLDSGELKQVGDYFSM